MIKAQKCKRHKKILRPHKLIQEVYQGFCISSKANEYANKKRYEVAIEARTAKGI